MIERLDIVLRYYHEMDLDPDPGKTIDWHYQWLEQWMWVAVNEITGENDE